MELHAEAVDRLDHHTRDLAEDMAYSLAVVEGSPDHAPWEDPEVDHVRRRWVVLPVEDTVVDLPHLEGPFLQHASVGRPYARAQRLVLERILG